MSKKFSIVNYFMLSYSTNTAPNYKIIHYALSVNGEMRSFAKYIARNFPGALWHKAGFATTENFEKYIPRYEKTFGLAVIMRDDMFQIICHVDIFNEYFKKHGYVNGENDLDE